MAASRKRMNGETPDYSIKGAAKGLQTPYRASAPPSSQSLMTGRQQGPAVKSNDGADSTFNEPKPVQQKLSKLQKQNKDAKKSRNSSVADLSQKAAAALTGNTTPTPKPSSIVQMHSKTVIIGGDGNGYLPMQQRTSPLRMDSPTLGYTMSEDQAFGVLTRPQPSSDSGYGSTTPSTATNATNSRSPSDANTTQEAKTNRLPRIDSGFVPKLRSSKELAKEPETSKGQMKEGKSLVVSSTADSNPKGQNKSNGYVSRLDPGPTSSSFAEPLRVDKTTLESLTAPSSKKESARQMHDAQVAESRERGRSTGQKLTQSQDTTVKGPTQTSNPIQTRSTPAVQSPVPPPLKQEEPQSFFAQPTRSSTPPPAKSPGVEAQREASARTYTLPSAKPQKVDIQRTSPVSRQTAKFPDLEPQPAAAPKSSNHTSLTSRDVEPQSAAKTQMAAPPSPKPVTSGTRNAATASTPPSFSRPIPQSAGQQRREPSSSPALVKTKPSPFENQGPLQDNVAVSPPAGTQQPVSEPKLADLIERRSTLPPLSVLEGFKVNKRGQVLDEEGDVIGELFEGDIIDCVRQKANAIGDVVDEFGSVVGRVRTVPRGQFSAPRLSVSSAPGIPYPNAPFQSDHRASSASQQIQPTYLQSHRGSVSHVTPAVHGNVLIVELDASTEAEAAPMIDQSEIFSPFEPKSLGKRTESPPSVSKAELSANPSQSRRPSQPKLPDIIQESPVVEQKPKKWTSRYFDPGAADTAPRRSSLKPDIPQSPTTESIASPRSSNALSKSASSAGSRAVIGPTLESLLEQEPSPSLPSSKSETHISGSSTPGLSFDATTMNALTSSQSNSPRQYVSSEDVTRYSSVSLHSGQPPSAGTTAPRLAATQSGAPVSYLSPKVSVRSSYTHHQPMRRSPLGSYGKIQLNKHLLWNRLLTLIQRPHHLVAAQATRSMAIRGQRACKRPCHERTSPVGAE